MPSKRSRSASLASLRTLAALALSASLFAGCNCGRAPTLQRSGVCSTGETQTCGPQDVGECKHGTQTCTGKNEWGPCDGAVYPSAETCDGKDNDCDGQVD